MAKAKASPKVVPLRSDFGAVEIKPVEWLWPTEEPKDFQGQWGRIPQGTLALIVGTPGKGKSLFGVFLAAEVSRAGKNVIFSSREDSHSHVVRPRLEAAGADLSKVHRLEEVIESEHLLMLPQDMDRFFEAVDKVDAKLVIFDMAANHLGVNVHNDQEVRKALTPLAKYAERTGCTFVFVHHALKKIPKNVSPLSVIGGPSGGLVGAAKAIFFFGISPQNEDERILVPVKMNFSELPPGMSFELDQLEWEIKEGPLQGKDISTGRLVMLSDDVRVPNPLAVLQEGGATTESAEKRAMAGEWLTEILAKGHTKVDELKLMCSIEGISWRTLRRAADEIGIEKQKHGFGKGSYTTWGLPDDHPAIALAQTNKKKGK